jgi:hypothetical protein
MEGFPAAGRDVGPRSSEGCAEREVATISFVAASCKVCVAADDGKGRAMAKRTGLADVDGSGRSQARVEYLTHAAQYFAEFVRDHR